jgi:hypothetical protein
LRLFFVSHLIDTAIIMQSSLVTFDRVQQKIFLLKQLLKVYAHGDQYTEEVHGLCKEIVIRQHKYGHLDVTQLQAKLSKWMNWQTVVRQSRICFTFYNESSALHSVDEMRELLLSCFGVPSAPVTFMNVANWEMAERVGVFVLEDARQTQRFELEFDSQFDHVIEYEPGTHWLYNLLRVKMTDNVVVDCKFFCSLALASSTTVINCLSFLFLLLQAKTKTTLNIETIASVWC